MSRRGKLMVVALAAAAFGGSCMHASPATSPGSPSAATGTSGPGVEGVCAIMVPVTEVRPAGVVPRQKWDSPAMEQALSSAIPLLPDSAIVGGEPVVDHFRKVLTASRSLAVLSNDKSLSAQNFAKKYSEVLADASNDIDAVLAWVGQECNGAQSTRSPGIS